MAAESRPAPYEGVWTRRARSVDEWMSQHKVVVSATAASGISTFAGFPLDSLKSRLQSSRENVSIPRLAAEVVREEGVGGLWRGFPLPLITISIVRTISFTIYTSTKRILNSIPDPTNLPSSSSLASSSSSSPENGEGSSSKQPWVDLKLGLFTGDTAKDVALTSMIAGGASGAVVCLGSAPFELVKVRRQLEYQIYRDSHPELFRQAPHPSPLSSGTSLPQHPAGTSVPPPPPPPPSKPAPFTPPTTLQAVRLIVSSAGVRGLYTGWRLHFIRDMSGTALYFAEYDVMRHLLGRTKANAKGKERAEGEGEIGSGGEIQGDLPEWARPWLPKTLVPFLCGSFAGVTSWALIYPVDAIKTKAQQRALSGLEPRTPLTQLRRLVRGTDLDNPKPWLTGIARLYRGLGVSMVRSMLTHGLLWTIVDAMGGWIDTEPFSRLATSQGLA